MTTETGLRAALIAARDWHEVEDKALSKQPPSYGPNGTEWARLQHKEQIAEINAALALEPTAAAEPGRAVDPTLAHYRDLAKGLIAWADPTAASSHELPSPVDAAQAIAELVDMIETAANAPFETVQLFAQSIGWNTTARCVRRLAVIAFSPKADAREPVAACGDVIEYGRDLVRASPMQTGKTMVAVEAEAFERFAEAVKAAHVEPGLFDGGQG